MVRAWVLVECEIGQIASATRELEKLDGVIQADATLGSYDTFLCVEKPDVEAIGNFVTDKVQAIRGVKRTTTCLSVKLG